MTLAEIPEWLYDMGDGVYYDGCYGEEDWMQALECGTFADAWMQKCAIAQLRLLDDTMARIR